MYREGACRCISLFSEDSIELLFVRFDFRIFWLFRRTVVVEIDVDEGLLFVDGFGVWGTI